MSSWELPGHIGLFEAAFKYLVKLNYIAKKKNLSKFSFEDNTIG